MLLGITYTSRSWETIRFGEKDEGRLFPKIERHSTTSDATTAAILFVSFFLPFVPQTLFSSAIFSPS
jgi:hypothetical protein